MIGAGYGSVINDMTLYDMCFHFADFLNLDSEKNYCSNMSKEDSKKNPFYYPYKI